MLQKVVYPCEYMDDCEKYNETLLPEKEDFHSHLRMEDIPLIQNCSRENISNYWVDDWQLRVLIDAFVRNFPIFT